MTPTTPPTSAHRVILVAFPGVQMITVAGPMEIFDGANRLLRRAGSSACPYFCQVLTLDGRPVRSANGMLVAADDSLGSATDAPIHTLLVPGGLGLMQAMVDEPIVRWIHAAAKRATRVVSLCAGAFVLAEAGLLSGREVTTHWAASQALAERYPDVQVQPDRIFVRSGNVYTSAGATAGMDLALALVEEDHGSVLALTLARWLVMFLKRPGGQSQFSEQLRAQFNASPTLAKLLHWISSHLSADLSVPALATLLKCSARQVSRTFRKELGTSPAAYIHTLRVESARRQLEEHPRVDLSTVAQRVGFSSEEAMRRAFLRQLGVLPGDYVARFSGRSLASFPPP